MITGLLWLLGCQVVGEALVRAVDVPVPGPVVGLVLLLAVLHLRRNAAAADDGIAAAADGLLAHLQLFFVPAGVGVVAYGATLRHDGVPLLVAVVGSWVLGLVVVGWVVEIAVRRRAAPDGGGR